MSSLFGGANGVFVTGTDTGVGKTVLTAAICAATGALPMKPVQTGSTEAEDLAYVLATTGQTVNEDVACPYRFAEPLAPSVAAARAGTRIDPDRIRTCFMTLAAAGPVAVEGAGGLLVEIAAGFTMAELALKLRLPVVVACRPGLGTLNHAALTVAMARALHISVLGLVIVGWPAEPDLATRTNPAQLSRLSPIAGVVPHIAGLAAGETRELGARAKEFLSPQLGGMFDARSFLKRL